ncbi:MAG: hypothetical protein QOI15_2986 [Pseudonocardiales bacterium]|jgi:uncharacterized protein with FMN-binding domain|nr:hypothetical protein [Pseudonocardiales bacterium]MDT4922084.1 hypothetical protein [Pseudonocardiales bacterium]MDT4941187.1 hypothetical protein [Pseudonocardiales bacterium]
MKRVLASLFGTITGLVLLLNFKTNGSTAASAPPAITATGPDTGTAGAGPTPTSSTSTPASKSTKSASKSTKSASNASTSKTITGDSIDTQWGPVQVRITVTNGKLASVTAIDYPWNNGRDEEINSYAVPALNQEALAAGSAQIDMISGATYTSTGYINSLQSALNKAGL